MNNSINTPAEQEAFTPKLASIHFHIETVLIPYILVQGKAIRFTNVVFTNKSSGDEKLLVVTPKGKYLFLEIGYEPDCDGAFYWNRLSEEAISLEDYDVNDNCYWDSKELFKTLNLL